MSCNEHESPSCFCSSPTPNSVQFKRNCSLGKSKGLSVVPAELYGNVIHFILLELFIGRYPEVYKLR